MLQKASRQNTAKRGKTRKQDANAKMREGYERSPLNECSGSVSGQPRSPRTIPSSRIAAVFRISRLFPEAAGNLGSFVLEPPLEVIPYVACSSCRLFRSGYATANECAYRRPS